MTEPVTPDRREDAADVGWSYYVKGDYAHADEAFRKALATDPDSIEANYGMGLLLKARGETQQSYRLFKKVIERLDAGVLNEKPSRAVMLRHLAETHLRDITPEEWQPPAE